MGCFSYICKRCQTPINVGDGLIGEHCTMFLLEKGKVIETRVGFYDNYGNVEGADDWEMDWGDCNTLHFDPDKSNGFAVYHTRCYRLAGSPTPVERSDNDPNQGWKKVRQKYLLG